MRRSRRVRGPQEGQEGPGTQPAGPEPDEEAATPAAGDAGGGGHTHRRSVARAVCVALAVLCLAAAVAVLVALWLEAPLGLSDSTNGVRWAACGFVVLVCGLSWLASASECCCGCMRSPRAAPKPRRP